MRTLSSEVRKRQKLRVFTIETKNESKNNESTFVLSFNIHFLSQLMSDNNVTDTL